MMAITTSNSIRVKPQWRERTGRKIMDDCSSNK